MKYSTLGKTDLKIPQIIFGTSALGNLYQAHDFETKMAIVKECFRHVQHPVFDSAGKYGAGLALEILGKCFEQLDIDPDDMVLSNKLGWIRKPLTTEDPTFEPGVWHDIQFDAEQKISYQGILECWKQGNDLLGERYAPQLLSVHDPDEYVEQGKDQEEKQQLLENILEAYRALSDLKEQGKIKAIGIGSKDWSMIRRIAEQVELDWVMFANSLTIMNHPPELLDFIEDLAKKNITVINSAVFHGGFLTGSDYYDYKLITPESDPQKFQWRASFFAICEKYKLDPSVACVNFGMTPPGVATISLNTSNPHRVKSNVESVLATVPKAFYADMVKSGLIRKDYPYLDL